MKQKVYSYYSLLIFTVLFGGQQLCAQHMNTLTVKLNGETKELNIQQEFIYKNASKFPLEVLYFNDWPHAYSNKNTGLAERFAEEFKKVFISPKNMNVEKPLLSVLLMMNIEDCIMKELQKKTL